MSFDYRGIFGFDISTWQDSPLIAGNVDFHKMRNYGASFVILKASQGNWSDPDFATGWANAKGVLPRASYHYYSNYYDPRTQADTFHNVIKNDPEGICWLDLEDRSTGIWNGYKNWFDFIVRMESYGHAVGIYTNYFYWFEFMQGVPAASRDWFKRFPLWLACYPADPFKPDYKAILVPEPWDEYLILQSGTPAIGESVGVESKEVDYNQFNGDAAKFRTYFGDVISIPVNEPETPAEPETKTITYWTGKLTRDVVTFSEPNKSGKRRQIKPGKIKKGTVVRGGSNKLGSWTRIYSPVSVTVKTKQLPKDYMQVIATVPVTPPATKRYKGYRCLHASEGGFVNPDSMPNVRRAKDISPVKFTPALQRLAVEVMRAKNPEITESSARAVFNGERAFTNGHGIESNDPKLMDGIICAGAFISDPVSFEDGYLVALPGVHAIDPSKPLPTAQEVIDRGWFFVATTGKGASGAFNFPQGKGGPVCVIYALAEPARYQKSWFVRWESDVKPDALRYGG